MRDHIIHPEPIWSPATDARTRGELAAIPRDASFFDEEPTKPDAITTAYNAECERAHAMMRESDRALAGRTDDSLHIYAEYRVISPEERWSDDLPAPKPITTVAELRKAEREMFCPVDAPLERQYAAAVVVTKSGRVVKDRFGAVESIGFAPTESVRMGPAEPLPEFVPSDGIPLPIGEDETTKPKSAPASSELMFTSTRSLAW